MKHFYASYTQEGLSSSYHALFTCKDATEVILFLASKDNVTLMVHELTEKQHTLFVNSHLFDSNVEL